MVLGFLFRYAVSMATEFQKSVWKALEQIPRGRVTSYGEIARYLGKPRAVRAVGTAVGKNPNAPKVPCHRVVPVSGKIGNYSGEGGALTKIKLLKKEGLHLQDGKVMGLEECFYSFV